MVEGQVAEVIGSTRPTVARLAKDESLDLVWQARIGRVPRESRRKLTDVEVLGFLYLDLHERMAELSARMEDGTA